MPHQNTATFVTNRSTAVDIAALRSTHRICGSLTGTLPHVSQQNVFMGVPLLLMPEEVVLLVQNGQSRDHAI